MNINENKNFNISKREGSELEKEKDEVENYITETLMLTPRYNIEAGLSVKISARGPKETDPSIKIFRNIAIFNPTEPAFENLLEVHFQDTVDILNEEGVDLKRRGEINFIVLVNKDTYEYDSIYLKPDSIHGRTLESVDFFNKLSKQEGARFSTGSWLFESDGIKWVPKNSAGKTIEISGLRSIMPNTPSLNE